MAVSSPYEHTQLGWAVLASLLLPPLALLPLMALPVSRTMLVVAVLALVVAAVMFGSLTVRVDSRSLSFCFGIGLVRRSIDLAEIVAYASVQNPWRYGIGIHPIPNGRIYNVSGRYAVELALRDGSRVRIGTDEPDRLCEALHGQLGPSQPMPSEISRRPSRRRLAIAVALLAAIFAGIGLLLRVQGRPAVVTVTPTEIRIDSLFYGDAYPRATLKHAELVSQLPAIRMRTNGYALKGTLRGWFLLDELGAGKLFVEMANPPFLLLQSSKGYVFVSYEDPLETERLFAQIRDIYPSIVSHE